MFFFQETVSLDISKAIGFPHPTRNFKLHYLYLSDTESFENHMKYNGEKSNKKKNQNHTTKTTVTKRAVKTA